MNKKKKILLVNWGTETSIYVIRECVKLKKYNFYLVSTKEIPKSIQNLIGSERIVYSNPYDPIKLCEDVSQFMEEKNVVFDVVTTFFEMCVYQTAFLAEYLGIERRLPLKDSLKTSVNKYLMRMELEKFGLGQPNFFKFGEGMLDEAYRYFVGFGTSAVIKPIHSGHSYGVRYVDKGTSFIGFKKLVNDAKRDYGRNYDEWMKYENLEKIQFLLEEYIDGKIYSFDGVVGGRGDIDFIGSVEYELSKPPVLQQIGHTIPIYSLNIRQIKIGMDYVRRVVTALNLQYCGFHGEIKYRKGKPVLIEISGRLPGGIITNAHQNVSEFNVIDRFLSVFDKEKRNIIKNKQYYACETMKIIYSENEVGFVDGGLDKCFKKTKNYVYSLRSRKRGDEIYERGNPFGVWLYEVLLRSKNLPSAKLVLLRTELIKKQRIAVKGSSTLIILRHKLNELKRWVKSNIFWVSRVN